MVVVSIFDKDWQERDPKGGEEGARGGLLILGNTTVVGVDAVTDDATKRTTMIGDTNANVAHHRNSPHARQLSEP